MSTSSPGGGSGGRPPLWVVILGLLVLMARLTEAAQNLRHVLADSDSTKTEDDKIKPKTSTTNELIDTEAANSNLAHDAVVEDTAGPISTPIAKNAAAKDTTEKNLRHLAESSNNNDQDVPDDEVEPDFMYWVTPLQSLGLTCGGSAIKSRDGEYTCIKAGEALCQDNDGGPFGRWTFGITEDNQVNLWTPKNEIAWTFCTEVSHVCIGEERDPRPDRYSNQRPYLYFYDEKTQRTVGNLTCDGTDGLNDENLDKPTILKMVDNSDVGMYAENVISVLKFKKGQTPDPGDSNELLNITVETINDDLYGSLNFNENKCTWTQSCPSLLDPLTEYNLHPSDPVDIVFGHYENGTEIMVSLLGDVAVAYSQVVQNFGKEVADGMRDDGFLFIPEEEETDSARNLAIIGGRWNPTQGYLWERDFWCEGKMNIPFYLDQNYADEFADAVRRALKGMEQAIGVIRFMELKEYDNYRSTAPCKSLPKHAVRIHRLEDGCKEVYEINDFGLDIKIPTRKSCNPSSVVGRSTWSTFHAHFRYCVLPLSYTLKNYYCQKLVLPEDEISAIVHEMLHTLGFWHEQQRSDRDSYVEVSKDADFQYTLQSDSYSLGVPYDYASAMHYSFTNSVGDMPVKQLSERQKNPDINEPFDVSIYDERIPKKMQNTFNFRKDDVLRWLSGKSRLSAGDITQLRLMYQCMDGTRSLGEAQGDGWCTPECPCWPNAPYECKNNDDCQPGLICTDRFETLFLRPLSTCRLYGLDSGSHLQTWLQAWCQPTPVVPQPNKICQKCIGGKTGDKVVLSVRTKDKSNGGSTQRPSLALVSTTDQIQEYVFDSSLPTRGATKIFTIPLENDLGCIKSIRIVAGGTDAWIFDEIILYNEGSMSVADPKLEMDVCNTEKLREKFDDGCYDPGLWITNDSVEDIAYASGNCWELREGKDSTRCTPVSIPAPSSAPAVNTPTPAPSSAPSTSPTIRNCKVPDGQGQGDFLEGECLSVASCEADGKFAVPYQVGFPDGLQDSCKAEPCDVQCCVESAPPPTECVATTGEAGICTSDGGCDGDDVIGLDSESGCENFSTECDRKCCVPSSSPTPSPSHVPSSFPSETLEPSQSKQEIKLTAGFHGGFSSLRPNFGHRTAISGDYAVVSAPLNDENGAARGALFFYKRDGNDWILDDDFIGEKDGDRLGTALAFDGSSVFVGGIFLDFIYVLVRDASGNWKEETKLFPPSGIPGEFVIATDGTYTAACLRRTQELTVFHKQSSTWVLMAQITPPDPGNAREFCSSVAVHNGWILVGDPGNSELGPDAGGVYTFQYDVLSSSWQYQGKLSGAPIYIPPSPINVGDGYGQSVAMHGDYAFVGAPLSDAADINAGAVYVFKLDSGGTWTYETELLPSGDSLRSTFGNLHTISCDDNIVFIGAPNDSELTGTGGIPSLTGTGAVYEFKRDSLGTWDSGRKFFASDAKQGDAFGRSIALSEDFLLIGSPSYGEDNGAAYLYRR